MKLKELFSDSEIPVGFYFINTSEEVFGDLETEVDQNKELKQKWNPKFEKKSVNTTSFQSLPYKKFISRIIKV